MDELLSDNDTRTLEQLPQRIIDRAVAYMIRRYGGAAFLRAAARQQFLLDQGEIKAAAHWGKVAEAIAMLAQRPMRKAQ